MLKDIMKRKDIVVQYKSRTVIGLTEKVLVKGKGKGKEVMARVDTGATKSSMDMKLAAELSLGPVLRTKLVKSASGSSIRPVLKGKVEIANKEIISEFTLADRSHMKYKVLIGQDILVDNAFIIDPTKKGD